MNHPYLNFSLSTEHKGKLVVGTSSRTFDGNGLFNKSVKIVEIPGFFNGLKVAELGNRCFCCTGIISIFIPKTILLIRYAALASCHDLTDVRFEKGSKLQIIEHHLFWDCTSLKKVDFPYFVSELETVERSPFFYSVSLDCFYYAGTHDFSSLEDFFSTTVNKIYVSNDYKGEKFAGRDITARDKTCEVSKDHLEVPFTGVDYKIICKGKISSCTKRPGISFCAIILPAIHS